MRLLVAYDGSPAARAAVAAAGDLLGAAEALVLAVRDPELHDVEGAMARVRLPHDVVRAGLEEIERSAQQRGRTVADEGVELARAAGLDARPVVEAAARPWRAILAAADREDADAIVCGTTGHHALGRALLGSTSSALLHRARRPVLVIPAADALPAGPVVIGYDGGDRAGQALRFAAAHVTGRAGLVATVWRSPVRHSVEAGVLRSVPVGSAREFVAELDAAYEDAARATAEEGAEAARGLGMAAEARALESAANPWRSLAELAAAEHAPLIVVGAERAAADTVLGSVSSGLVHHARTGILVVPGG